jgi:hypothetical protein
LLSGGYVVTRAQDREAEAAAQARLEAEKLAPVVEEPPPPPPPRAPRDNGVWREVPPVFGDDAP